MAEFFVEKIIWEFGEDYGHVYHPENLLDLKEKIDELDAWGRGRDYPFFIEMHLTDHSYLGFTVAHKYSLLEFGYNGGHSKKGPFYLHNPDGNINELIPIYYFASYSEPDTTRMLPLEQVLEAVFHYVEHRTFPSFIQFDVDEINKKFVVSNDL
jgi:hypothetical protein